MSSLPPKRDRPRTTGPRGDWDITARAPEKKPKPPPKARSALKSTKGLARTGPPERKTRIAPVSDKGKAKSDEFDTVLPLVLARDDHRCQAASTWQAVECCGGLTAHHRRLRSQGGTNDMDNLVTVCNCHHVHIHANPAEAVEHGFIISVGVRDRRV